MKSRSLLLIGVIGLWIGCVTSAGSRADGSTTTVGLPSVVQPGGMATQLTSAPRNHFISPFGPFSPDGQWIVYDTREDEAAMGRNSSIEQVNTHNGQIAVIYETSNQGPYGPGCGTPSYSPVSSEIIFIHGILQATAERPYDFSRRIGAMTNANHPGEAVFLDARDVTPPFTPGALRGGTHAHEWSGDGNWIGFTYNDAIVADIEKRTGKPVDLRTVGVSTRLRPVRVDKDPHGENNDGKWYSVLVARVTPNPAPGSDEISRAFENAWVGAHGYRREDGTLQRAQAYLGKLRTRDNRELIEVFIVDIPERIDITGSTGPLEGTDQMMPQPPQGCIQRRLTFTEHNRHPGVVVEPRHWVFSSADGEHIGFLAKDDRGVVQLFAVSPRGGQPLQITRHAESIHSTFSWHPNDPVICYATGNSIFSCRIGPNNAPAEPIRLTEPAQTAPIYPSWSRDGKSIAYNLALANGKKAYRQIILLRLTDAIVH